MTYELADFARFNELSVAMTEDVDATLRGHLDRGPQQEDLVFAYWRPSVGSTRFTAILFEVVPPVEGDRVLHGNVAFNGRYLDRLLRHLPEGAGVALLHSHLGPGWQGMSPDDVHAEQVRLGGAVAARSGQPVLGLTRGTDGAWSARFWLRSERQQYERRDCQTVRIVGTRLSFTHLPHRDEEAAHNEKQVATISVWGAQAQRDLARTHVAVVGLGSVGSLVAEALARTGVRRVTLIDHDVLEERNLDRTTGATTAELGLSKVDIAKRNFLLSATAHEPVVHAVPASVTSDKGIGALLSCDVAFSCVDRPLPRHLLNLAAYSHLIPVIDGGILAGQSPTGRHLHLTWSVQTVGPSRACLYCLGSLRRSDVALDREGLLEDPDYITGVSHTDREKFARRNVFAFSMAVAAHETLHLAGLVSGIETISGRGPQRYHGYPGAMHVQIDTRCESDCEIASSRSSATSLSGIDPRAQELEAGSRQGLTLEHDVVNIPVTPPRNRKGIGPRLHTRVAGLRRLHWRRSHRDSR